MKGYLSTHTPQSKLTGIRWGSEVSFSEILCKMPIRYNCLSFSDFHLANCSLIPILFLQLRLRCSV